MSKKTNLLKFLAITAVSCVIIFSSHKDLPAIGQSTSTSQRQSIPRDGFYNVSAIVDGDGIRVAGIDREIRFACVNAEENDYFWGRSATNYLVRTLSRTRYTSASLELLLENVLWLKFIIEVIQSILEWSEAA
jgi:endonuclease YncB( thermonuclease family)